MRNRDEPAGAYTAAIYRDEDRPVEFVGGAEGLTKRQAAAISMAQGMLSGSDEQFATLCAASDRTGLTFGKTLTSTAVALSDDLFDELEKTDAKG